VLVFDYSSTAQGQIQSIGLDNDAAWTASDHFQVYGTDTSTAGLRRDFRSYAAAVSGAVKHYVIPVGKYYTGSMSYVAFVNTDGGAQSTFSNVRIFEANSATTQYGYNGDGSLTSVTDAETEITTYTYPTPDRGLPDSMIKPKGYGTQNYKTTYTYSDAGQVKTQATRDSASDPWITTYFAYDSYGRGELVGTTDGKGSQEGDPAHTTVYAYDLLGRRTKQTLPDADGSGPLPAPVTVYLYDAAGNVISTSLATARPQETTNSVYDKMNRAVKVVNGDGTYHTIQYDGAGNVVAQTDELGRVTQFVYDLRNRLVTTIRPDGTTVSSQYNGGGLVVASTDALGNTTHFEYDKLGRKTAEVLPYNGLLSTEDDNAATYAPAAWDSGTPGYGGGCQTVTNSPASTATWAFTLPASTTTGKFYEVLVTWPTDPTNSHAAPYRVYDGSSASATYWDRAVDQVQGPPAQGFFTDAGWYSLGRFWITGTTLTVRLSGVADSRVVADAIRVVEVDQNSYGYDSQGNLQYASVGGPLADINYTTEYRYDKLGRQKAAIQPDADGNASTHDRPITLTTYDADWNVASVVDPRGASDDTWDSSGNLVDTLGNDAAHTTQYTYDQMDRKNIVTLPDPAGDGNHLYTWFYYDANSNLQYVVNANGASASRPDTFSASANYTTEYVVDALNRKVQEKLPDADGGGHRPITSYAFDATGNLASVTNPLGAVTRYGYDLRNRQTQVTDALGDTTTTTFDAVGNVIFVTDALGRRTDFEYDSLNRKVLATLPLPDGNTSDLSQTAWVYDNNGNLVATLDPRGYWSWTIYDAWNRPVEVTDAMGTSAGDPNHTVTTTYDQLGRVIAVTDQLGRVTQYVYDNLGRKIETIAPDPDDYRASGGTDGSLTSAVTYFGYDANGNLKYVTSSPSDGTASQGPGDTRFTTWYFYDTLNRQVCVIDPLGEDFSLPSPDSINLAVDHRHSVVTTYDKLGDVTAVKQAVDVTHYRTTTYQFDNLGRKIAEVAPDPGNSTHPTTQFVYDLAGNLVETIDPLNHTTWNKYDLLGRVVRTVDARGTSADDAHFATTTVYDAVGKATSTTDPDGNTTSDSFDRLDRLVKETDPLWNDTHFWFDPAGNTTAKVDRDGQITQYDYDALNRPVEEDWGLPVTHAISKSYDDAGELLGVSETDIVNSQPVNSIAGSRYEYAYDQGGQMIRNRMAPGDLTQELPGQVNGNVSNPSTYYLVFTLNDMRTGDVIHLEVQGTGFNPSLLVVRPNSTYLLISNGTTALSVDVTADDPYDENLGYTTWLVYVGSADGRTGSYSCHGLVNPTVPTALTELNYSYYVDGSLKSAADSVYGLTEYQYNGAGQMTRQTQRDPENLGRVASKRVDFDYNDAGQVLTATRYNATTQTNWVATSTSTYDGMGRLTDLNHTFDSTNFDYAYTLDGASRITHIAMPQSKSVDFTNGYDAANQLIAASFSNQANESYSLDQNGNRTDANWTTGANSRLLTAPSSGVVYTYTTDAEGNRTSRFRDYNGNGIFDSGDGAVTFYYYDNRNRLVEALSGSGYGGYVTNDVYFSYDYLGRETVRAFDSTGDRVPDEFRYNIFQGDNRTLEVWDQDGLGGGTYLAYLTHRDFSAAGLAVAVEDSNHVVHWAMPDSEGTVRDDMVLSGGTWYVWHRDYDSYGVLVSGTIDTNMPYGYAGMWTDTATGLNLTVTRVYDPTTERWLTEDETLPPPDANDYRYVHGNPWNETDPTGRFGQLVSPGPSSYWPTSGLASYTGVDYTIFGDRINYSPDAPATLTPRSILAAQQVPVTTPVGTWNTANVVGHVQANYPRSEWDTGLLDAVHPANQTGTSFTMADVQAAQTTLQTTKQQLDSWSAGIQNPGPYRSQTLQNANVIPLQPGESVPPRFQPGGPSDLPTSLPGTWKVSVVAGGGHAWIRYENVNDPSDLHWAGRYEHGFGGRTDENGNVVIPPVAVAGVQWDREESKEEGVKSGMFPSRSVVIDNPTIFNGGANGQFGFAVRNNNCTTYAADAWKLYSGESAHTGVLWDDPGTLENWIKQRNAPASPGFSPGLHPYGGFGRFP
jgi:RHS repeat-associated protein